MTSAGAPADLVALSDSAMRAWNGDDPAAVARFFSGDAMAMTPDSSYSGLDAIENDWIRNGLPAISDLSVIDREFSGGGDALTESGNYRYTLTLPDQPAELRTGTYTSTWERQQRNGWKITSMRVLADTAVGR
jgi:ketosteroid isomerase-like protein